MISLFAQAAPETAPIHLPISFYGVSIAAIGGIVVLILVVGKLFKGMREFRADVASEIKREIETSAKVQRIDVQQPLSVRPHADFVLQPDYVRDQETNNERHKAAKESREKIHENLKNHEARISSLEKGEKHTDAALAVIDQKLTTVLQRLPQKNNS